MIDDPSEFDAAGKNGFDRSFRYDAATVLAITRHLVEIGKALNWSREELIAAATRLQILGILEVLETLPNVPPRST